MPSDTHGGVRHSLSHTQTHTHEHKKEKVLLRHMCPGVIYEWAPGRTPQRGPLHAAWLWVLCTIPPVSAGPHAHITHKQGSTKSPL